MKTKLLLLFLLFSQMVYAQEKEKEHRNIISIEPIALINRFKIKYERLLNDKFTTGAYVSYYPEFYSWNKITGIELAPFLRYYFSHDAPDGFYMQVKPLLGYYQSDLSYMGTIFDSSYTANFGWHYYYHKIIQRSNFFGIGIGGDIGIQLLKGEHRRITIDCSIGVKYYPMPASIHRQIVIDGELYNLYIADRVYNGWSWNQIGGIGADDLGGILGTGDLEGFTDAGFYLSLHFSVGFLL